MNRTSPFADAVTSSARREAYLSAGLWDDTTLAGLVATHAASRPDDIAVIDEVSSHTYGQLAEHAAAVAGRLASRDVGAQSVVSVQLPNWYPAVVAAVAVQSLGAVVNPLLPNYRSRELAHIFTTALPRVVITPGRYRGFDHRDLIREVTATTGVDPLHVVVGDEPGPEQVSFDSLIASGERMLGPGRADSISELIFTSGTEARPKAVMHTEQTTNFSVRVAYTDLGLGPADVVWMPSPVGHSTGFNYGVRFALYHGLPLVLQDAWDADAAAAIVAQHHCSYTLAASTFLQDLTAAAGRSGVPLDSLRYFGCGGAPIPPTLVDAASERGIQVLRLYGSTEALVATWNRPGSTLVQRRETDGVAMTDVDLDVRDENGQLLPGSPGELYVRGPNTCVGFFDDPERTAAGFDDGWVRSGDVVTIDTAGYLTVVGRKKEIIIRGGLNITPREIEDLLIEFPEVERAAVVGLVDDRLGEKTCACVVLRPARTLDLETTVERLLNAGLATYKLPERLEVLDSLPMTASGKIQKHEIIRTVMAREA